MESAHNDTNVSQNDLKSRAEEEPHYFKIIKMKFMFHFFLNSIFMRSRGIKSLAQIGGILCPYGGLRSVRLPMIALTARTR